MEKREFGLQLRREDQYRFVVEFAEEGAAPLVMDEPKPLGDGQAPNAAAVLGAAVGHCLGASLLYCLERSRLEVADLRVQVSGTIVRNERGRLRIDGLRVTLQPDMVPVHAAKMQKVPGPVRGLLHRDPKRTRRDRRAG